MKITKVQAEALTAFVVRVRPEWRPAGVMAALEKAADTADVHDVACALIRLAQDTTVHTPGLLHQPGPHWLKPDGSKPARRGDHTMRCPEHDQRLPCEPCKTDVTPPPADVLAEARAALEEARTKNAKDANDRRERDQAKESR